MKSPSRGAGAKLANRTKRRLFRPECSAESNRNPGEWELTGAKLDPFPDALLIS